MHTTTPPPRSPRATARAALAARPAAAHRAATRVLAVLGALAVLLACWGSLLPPAHAAARPAPPVTPVVHVDSGDLHGAATSAGLEFRGVPYAAPPTGELRWKPPQPVSPWSGVRAATAYPPVCPQAPPSPNGQSEDCLYLNVTVPSGTAADAKLPVIVWIHGGGFELGEGADYEASDLASHGAVVVTINYRLGLLGFLSHPALADRGGASGNYGLMDQQAALRWVHRNIAGFGGDAKNVTIAGQSAGGLSVAMHLASPGAKGLFQRAVIQSGAFAPVQKTLAQAEKEGVASAAAVGCADQDADQTPGQTADCLRHVPVETLVAHQPLSITPGVVDGAVLPRSVGDAIATGRFHRVPILNGVNTQENRIFTTLGLSVTRGATAVLPGPVDASSYESTIATNFGVDARTASFIAKAYPLSRYASPAQAFSVLNSDANFSCPAFALDGAASAWVQTYGYEFNDAEAPRLFAPDTLGAPYAATHQSELAYLFNQPNAPLPGQLSPSQQQLADTMQTAWVQFARTGSPTTAATPWPRFDLRRQQILSLDDPAPTVERGFAADHRCGVWAAVALFGSH
ncbi:carboxylesterase/lipase family protein [Isoptericola sp. NPDC057191]|uniref:carboxylesterase/lipase family protein n=1 Tax=Isoptericola sp. NPDC057191 TaxID=3346041 RepID=UPI00362C81F4